MSDEKVVFREYFQEPEAALLSERSQVKNALILKMVKSFEEKDDTHSDSHFIKLAHTVYRSLRQELYRMCGLKDER